MTTSPSHRTGTARTAAGTASLRRARGTGLLALALAAATSTATLAAVPASSSPADQPLTRVVVSGAGGVSAAAAAVVAAGGTVLDRLPLVGGVSAELPTGSVLAPSLSVVPDREVQLATADPAAAAGPASTVRETLGLGTPAGEGAGTTIAVVDTGVADHPDLAGRVTRVDVSGAGAGDGYGHGTFVAGVAAGSGAASGGKYAGVAPAAQVLDVRVADAEGATDLITVLRGLEVVRARGASVVNLSLSSYSPLPWQVDPLTVALTSLWRSGVVVVVPAGNDGPEAGSVTSPGVAPALLTVGALDESGTAARADDVVPSFSARGPAPQGVSKPELVAPGRSLVSLRAPGSVIDTAHGDARIGETYFKGSGTSFSTAVVAGAAAALRGTRALTPDQVKLVLTSTAYEASGLRDVDAAGAGGLDLRAASAAAAPVVEAGATCKLVANGKRAKACTAGAGTGVPGSVGDWTALQRALVRGDAAVAASSWSKLSAEAQAWVASSWSALPLDLREELTAEWVARNWAGGTAEEWAARNWAARNWAARNWAASSWSARNWAASSWSGSEDDWLAGWSARHWAARNWAARNWAASSWSARNWAASSWSARNWAAENWSDGAWTARNWAARNWAARNWAAVEWGA